MCFPFAGRKRRSAFPVPLPTTRRVRRSANFLAIAAGRRRLIGMITEVSVNHADGAQAPRYGAIAQRRPDGRDPQDAAGANRFRRGVAEYPAIGDAAGPSRGTSFGLSTRPRRARHQYRRISITTIRSPRFVDVDNLLTKHFAVLGSTGVGKSSGVAVILGEILNARPALRHVHAGRPQRIWPLLRRRAPTSSTPTISNCRSGCSTSRKSSTSSTAAGRPSTTEIDILAELVPIAKGMYLQHKAAVDRLVLRKIDLKSVGYTVDTPVPYLLQDLILLIDERMGKLENRSSRMHYHRLINRIETISERSALRLHVRERQCRRRHDGGDSGQSVPARAEREADHGHAARRTAGRGRRRGCLRRSAAWPSISAFGATARFRCCSSARRRIATRAADHTSALRRLAARCCASPRRAGNTASSSGWSRSGPAELDPTIISQCSTLFAMRLANDRDQAFLALRGGDAAANLLAFVPSLGTREVVAFGEGVPLPTRMTFKALPPGAAAEERSGRPFASLGGRCRLGQGIRPRPVVERWRGAALRHRAKHDDAASDEEAAGARVMALRGQGRVG